MDLGILWWSDKPYCESENGNVDRGERDIERREKVNSERPEGGYLYAEPDSEECLGISKIKIKFACPFFLFL